jgi:hypothetical protein
VLYVYHNLAKEKETDDFDGSLEATWLWPWLFGIASGYLT